MIDITDGLTSDLSRFNRPGCIASINLNALPLSDSCRDRHLKYEDAMQSALSDGEDYELLFTVDGNTDSEAFLNRWRDRFDTPLSSIGNMIEPPSGAKLPGDAIFNLDTGRLLEPYGASGYEHFTET